MISTSGTGLKGHDEFNLAFTTILLRPPRTEAELDNLMKRLQEADEFMTTLGMSGGVQQMRILAAQLASNSLDALRRWVNDPQIYNFFQRVSQSAALDPAASKFTLKLVAYAVAMYERKPLDKGIPGATRKAMEKLLARDAPDVAAQVAKNKSVIIDNTLYDQAKDVAAELLPDEDLGETGLLLTKEQKTRAKAADGIRFASYQTLMKRLNTNIQNAVMRICGGKHLPVAEVAAQLRQIGLPVLFNDSVPAAMNSAFDLFTLQGDMALDKPIPEVGKRVELNAEWTPERALDAGFGWYFKVYHPQLEHRDEEGETPYYTKDYIASRKQHKSDVIYRLIADIPRLQKKWRSGIHVAGILQEKDLTEKHLLNVMLEVVYQVACRSGHRVGNTGGEETFGLTVWKASHVTINNPRFDRETKKVLTGAVAVQYPGKDNQPQHHYIPMAGPTHASSTSGSYPYVGKSASTIALLKTIADKNGEDFLWVVRAGEGKGRRITAQVLNKHLKEISGEQDYTLHKFRHAKGTGIALRLLEAWPYNREKNSHDYFDPKLVEKEFQDAMLAVGKELGHFNKGVVTWRTAVINYVDPGTSRKFFDLAGVRIPEVIAAEIRKASA